MQKHLLLLLLLWSNALACFGQAPTFDLTKTIGTLFTLLDLSTAEAISTYPNPARSAVTLDWQRAGLG